MRSSRARLSALVAVVLTLIGLPVIADAQARKPVVAVREMKDMAGTGQAPALGTMIQTAVGGTGKFRVIERDFAVLTSEQQLANSGMTTTNTPGRTGGFEGADFLIYGTITSASGSRQSDTGANAGRAFASRMLGMSLGGNCQRATSNLAIDIKIVDGKTGEIRYTKQINQLASTKTSCSGDAGMDMTALMRSAANQTAMGLVTTIYPIKVASVQQDGTFFLNYGEGMMVPGMLMAVYGTGNKVVDPDTGAVLSDEGPMLGTVRVTEVTTRFSKAVATTPFTAPIGAIVREAPPSPPSSKRRK